MTLFRPCIDLHAGSVKQIVGGTLSTSPTNTTLVTNHISPHPPSHFATLYRTHALHGAHVIMLGPGNASAARGALAAWPGALQVGGGINDGNAAEWISAGASKVIVTSFLFPGGGFSLARLEAVLAAWQTVTDMEVNQESIAMLEPYCSEFLVHAADNEGLQRGIDEELVRKLAEWCTIPVTYAGGGRNLEDLELVKRLSGGKVDLTIGSALDCFGGSGVTLEECVEWNKKQESKWWNMY
ncbi:hypothetical protein B0T18DRAFT_483305 [Schizothecium vesticola]|uniref:1-(5-phosphoribosyl)-5-[(5-phosphoribosylamino)methylideneamino] imidazole-4-carboxamide isomerase n=1 Tax=Schizothecium vesticola TaxID=314040 RepID=A0AA40EEE1_9PEZI|nr:hypothetical protein B0T18DRAFT_483305 [Schizothecium vesticola]